MVVVGRAGRSLRCVGHCLVEGDVGHRLRGRSGGRAPGDGHQGRGDHRQDDQQLSPPWDAHEVSVHGPIQPSSVAVSCSTGGGGVVKNCRARLPCALSAQYPWAKHQAVAARESVS